MRVLVESERKIIRGKTMDLHEKRAIIFDKDGTLLLFEPFWFPVAKSAVRKMIKSYISDDKKAEDVSLAAEKALGIENDMLHPNGILSAGTYEQAAVAINEILKEFGIEGNTTREETEEAFENNLSEGKIIPTCKNLREKLERLKRSGKFLFLVTTDNPQITDRCLNVLRIRELFNTIYCDDGIHLTKPSPYAVEEIMRLYRLQNSDICMVGDTTTDIKFAKNARIDSVCVGNNKKASETADYTFDDVGVILDCLLEDKKGQAEKGTDKNEI